MRISTKTGDKGETSLLGGERASKSDARIDAYGDVDELNSAIGVALLHVENDAVKTVLEQVQHDLFIVGAELANLTERQIEIPRITAEHLEFLEKAVEMTEQALPAQKSFILPKGYLQLARAICRRAERKTVSVQQGKNPLLLKYLNRLSDLLFLFARLEGKDEKVEYSNDN